MTTAQQQTSKDETTSAAGRSAADGSPLDVMLTDAALGPIRRLVPGRAGIKLWARLASRPDALEPITAERSDSPVSRSRRTFPLVSRCIEASSGVATKIDE